MSKEMAVIALGFFVLAIPYLGLPGSWRTALLVLTGIAIAALGFLLRGEQVRREQATGGRSYSFIESVSHPREPESAEKHHIADEKHEHKDGITSFN